MDEKKNFIRLEDLTKTAVAHYWKTRSSQQKKQKERGQADQGLRSAVTGGAQMDGFIELFTDLIIKAGLPKECVLQKRNIELPGYFRPTKEWDLLVVKNGILVAAIEVKSQVGPSFGNNFNNRTEEAMGTALDLWTAYREGAFLKSPQPFIGYFFMLEDCPASNQPVSVRESHFKVFPEFVGASYLRRYELFCRKLVLERQYTASAFITSDNKTRIEGKYKIPAEDLSLERFVKTLMAHVESVK
jgi:hypothetical protein